MPGHPKVLARDLVEHAARVQSLDQFDVPVHLKTTAETISWEGEGEDRVVVLHTDRGELRSRTVIVAGGHGAFEPKKLPGYDMTPWEGRGAHYIVGEKSVFEGKRVMIVGGGDSACDWVINLLDTAERAQPGPPARGLPRPRGDRRPGAGGRRPRRRRGRTCRYQIKEVYGQRRRRARDAVQLRGRGARGRGRGRRDPAPARLQDRARAAEGLGVRGRSRARSSSTR